MNRLKNLTIKQQLRLLIAVVGAIIVLLFVVNTISYTQLTRNQTYAYFTNVTEQVSRDIELNLAQVKKSGETLAFSDNMQLFLFSTSNSTRQRYFNSAKDSMGFCIAGNRSVDSIQMRLFDSGKSIYVGNYRRTDLLDQIYEDYDLQNVRRRESFYTRVYQDAYSGAYFYAHVAPVFCVLPGYNPTEPLGVQIILCSSGIYEGINQIRYFSDITLFISDGRHVLDSSSSPTGQEDLQTILDVGTGSEENYEVDTSRGVLWASVRAVSGTPFKVYCAIPREELLKDSRYIICTAALIALPGLLLMLLLSSLVVRSITAPIGRLVKDMKRVGYEDAGRVARCTNNELGIIADAANDMLEKLNWMNESVLCSRQQVFDLEIERVRSELAFLYSQINPHFLYNSLNCIQSMAVSYEHADIAAMTVALSRILRYSIAAGNEVPLKEELRIMEDYFTVVNERYMQMFALSVDIPDELRECPVLKMMLQPIAENSVSHGMVSGKRSGRITVAATIDGEKLMLYVQDNGTGMRQEVCRALNERLADWKNNVEKKDNIGLINIQRRIKMTYGEVYGLWVESQPDNGTTVAIALPKVTGLAPRNLPQEREKET